MCLRRHDGAAGGASIRESQARLQVGVDGAEVWHSIAARTVRTFEPDALRSGGTDGEGSGGGTQIVGLLDDRRDGRLGHWHSKVHHDS